MSGDRFLHLCRQCAMPVMLGVMLAALFLLGTMRWLDEQRTDRFGERLATIEAEARLEQEQRNADAAATRVLVLALVTDPLPPVEVIEIDVRKATAPHGLSPVITDLLHELRRRSQARTKKASPAPDMRRRAESAKPGGGQ